MRRHKHSLSHLYDLLHVANKGMLDYVRDKTYQPQERDFRVLQDIYGMCDQLKVVSLSTHDALIRRRDGRPEVDETIG